MRYRVTHKLPKGRTLVATIRRTDAAHHYHWLLAGDELGNEQSSLTEEELGLLLDVFGTDIEVTLIPEARPFAPKLDDYVCGTCGVRGVKLWRVAASSHIEGFCSMCGTAQAGLTDTIGDDGRHTNSEYGLTDQIYSPDKGSGLVPWVVDNDGSTWGYTSVPQYAVDWWRNLPTRLAGRSA